MSQLSVAKLKSLTPDEAEAYATGVLTKKQVLKRAEYRRLTKQGIDYGTIKALPSARVKYGGVVTTQSERKAAYIKAWRAKNRIAINATARNKYQAEKNGTWVPRKYVRKAGRGLSGKAIATRPVGRTVIQRIVGIMFGI